MTTQDQLTYYRHQCVTLMNTIEDRIGKMIHETQYSKLEHDFWIAVDEKNINRIKTIHNELAKLTDSLNES